MKLLENSGGVRGSKIVGTRGEEGLSHHRPEPPLPARRSVLLVDPAALPGCFLLPGEAAHVPLGSERSVGAVTLPRAQPSVEGSVPTWATCLRSYKE